MLLYAGNLSSAATQMLVNEALTLIDTNRVGWTKGLNPFLRYV